MLTLLRLDIEDYRSYRGKHQIVLDLDPGLYNVTGKNLDNPEMGANGCGKSTLFDAIYWTLTGDMMDLSRPGDGVVPWRNVKKRVCNTLWLEQHDEYYGIKRQRGPNGLWLQTGRNGEMRPVDQPEVAAVLGLSPDALKRTILLGQFSTLFLDLTPTEQSDFFTKILDLDVWLELAKLADERYTEAQRQHIALESSITRMQGSISTTEDQIEQAKRDKAAWSDRNAEDIENDVETRDRAEVAHLQAKLALDKAVKPGAATAEVVALEAQIRKARSDKSEVVNEAIGWKADQRSDSRRHDELFARLTSLTAAEKSRTCPECGQRVELKHLTTKTDTVDTELQQLKEIVAQRTKALAASDAAVVAADDVIEGLEARLAPLRRKHEDAILTHATLAAAAGAAARELDRATAQLERTRTAANPHRTTEERLDRALTDLVYKSEDAAKELVGITEEVEAAELLKKYFKEIRLSMIDEVLIELEITIGAAAEQLGLKDWSIRFLTERELKSGGTSVGFTTMIYPPGETKGINWHAYSGGERQRWQLATTFGLSEVLLARAGIDSNIEVLDEPSKGTSPEGLAALIEYLSQRARTLRKAILLVDHHIFDRGLFDHTLVVTMKDGQSTLAA